VPWKNGGGITREVAIWPENASFDDFDWRISIADVREAGPFSKFENIDRTLMILKGRLSLAFADRTIELDTDSAPFAFRGEGPCSGMPLDGAVTDLNVMVRRGKCQARVSRLMERTEMAGARQHILVAPSAAVVRMGARSFALDAQDALVASGDAGPISANRPVFLIVLD